MATAHIDGGLLQALYETALYEGDWAPALQLSTEALGCAEVCLAAVDDGVITTYEITHRLLSEEARGRYAQHYGALDPKVRLMASGGLFNDSAHFDDAFVARDPFYQEFTRWVGSRHTLDMSLGADAARPVFFCAMRTAAEGPFQPAAERAFSDIAGHFGRVHALKSRLEDAQLRARYAEAALDGLTYGLVVLDGRGRPVTVNAKARRLLASGCEIKWRQGRLAARLPADNRELQGLMDRARAGADLAAASMRIPRAGEAGLIVWVLRLPPSSPLAGGNPGLLVMLGDSQTRGLVRRDNLMKIYALTPAEANLALAVAAGQTLREIAVDRAVSYATARSQLYAILDKTGLHRQADLARLIAALPGAILDDPQA